MTAAQRKLAASHRLLKQVIKEQSAAHNFAHRFDTHDMKNKGGSFAPLKVVGGDENKSSHKTALQCKIKCNDDSTLGTATKNRSILAQQQKSAGYLS